MRAIFEREVNAYFNSVLGYLCGAFILLFAGIFVTATNLLTGLTNFEYIFSNMGIIMLIVVPILTMRIFSEERRQKTDQLLYSLPMSMTKIVLGKYFAMLTVLLLPFAILCVYPYLLSLYGEVSLTISYASIGIFFLLSAALTAIGMFISSTTENQGMAAGICFVCMLLIYFASSLAGYVPSGALSSFVAFTVIIVIAGFVLNSFIKDPIISVIVSVVAECVLFIAYRLVPDTFDGLFASIVNELSLFDRYFLFLYGVIDVSAIVYYLSIIAVFIFLTVQSMEKRRWS